MAEDEKEKVNESEDKLKELVTLNLSLKNLFKDLIETVGKRLDKVNNSIKSMEDSMQNISKLEEKVSGIEEAIKNLNQQPPTSTPSKKIVETPPKQKIEDSKPKKTIEEDLASKKIDFDRPSRGPVDDIFKQLFTLIESKLSGEELAKKFEESRDKLMEHHSFHPVYHEMARVVNTLRKYHEDKLADRDIKELEGQIENWKERMLG